MNPTDTITVRPLQSKDMNGIEKIIKSYTTLYGADITSLYDSYLSGLVETEYVKSNIVEVNGELFGVATQTLWKALPAWAFGSLFLSDKWFSPLASKATTAMLNYMITFAENQDRFNFYHIVRDNDSHVRKNIASKMNLPFANRYNRLDVEVIRPYTVPKYLTTTNMMGPLSGKNSKTIVLRHSYIKPEFMKNLWETT